MRLRQPLHVCALSLTFNFWGAVLSVDRMWPGRADVVVVGAGVAGLATAYHLVRLGVRDVVVLEREPVCASHASGRNAGIFRQLDAERLNVGLALASAAHLGEVAWGEGLLRRCGSLTVASEGGVGRLREEVSSAKAAGADVVWLDGEEAHRISPVLARARIEAGAWAKGDGVLDIHGLTQGLLREARAGGARVWTGCAVERILVDGGRVLGVIAGGGRVSARTVVNAAGAWAGPLGVSSGASRLGLRPCRRHLVQLDVGDFDPSAPVVWDLSAPFYFRPESGGVLASACDEDEVEPGAPTVDRAVLAAVAHRAAQVSAALGAASVRQAWACIRTLTPDGLFAVGEDPAVRGLFWVAGLGGHGMSAGLEAGRIAAEAICGMRSDAADALAPRRLAGT